jgi:uncharacterized cupin superfamily protein
MLAARIHGGNPENLSEKPLSEASLGQTPEGLVPEGDGWFIVNVADARGMRSSRFGRAVRFEGEPLFPAFGINVRVLEPGQPNCKYHRENQAEAFLVLSGECIAIVEEQERPMKKGDFLYAPPWTAHVFVGAGSGPCSILMVGDRCEPDEVDYPVSEVAAHHGASVAERTDSAATAYADIPRPEPARIELPW